MVSMSRNRAADICLVLVVLTAVLVLVSSAGRQERAAPPAPWVDDIARLAAATPIPAGESVQSTELARGVASSVHLVQVRDRVAGHHHAAHDEAVCVVAGHGILTLGKRELEIGPGTAMFIPRGVPHAVVSADTTGELIAVSTFTPAFDGLDRVTTDEVR